MLELDFTNSRNEKQTRITQVRHDKNLNALIDQAVMVLGVKKSAFLHKAIENETQREVNQNFATC